MFPSTSNLEKPLSPYRPGVELVIQAHIPPPPFGSDYRNEDAVRRPVSGLLADNLVDKLDFALSNPPLETSPPKQAKSHVLTVLGKIDRQSRVLGKDQVHCYGGPHLVRCYLDSDKSRYYVAKIYDGIDYPLSDYRGYDCMYLADRDYSREAAAYENMPLSLQGSIVPYYFGSWTFSVETGMHRLRRCVRLILLEHIDSECMLDMILRAKGVTQTNLPAELFDTLPIDYQLLPPEPARLDVLASIVEADITLLCAGIAYRDIAPQNVLISHSPERIILVDFTQSRVYKCYEFGRQVLKSWGPNPMPISPIQRYWKSSLFTDEFAGWIPKSWFADEHKVLKWLCVRWGGSTKFAPLSKDFLSFDGHHPLLRGLLELKKRDNATTTS
jgi:hypothetical protein